MDQPIVVNENALPATLAALLRYAVMSFGAYAVGKGWVSADSLPGIAAMVVSIATVGYGLYRTHTRGKALATMAPLVSNKVAITK